MSIAVVSQGSLKSMSEIEASSYCGRGMALARDRVAMMESRRYIVEGMKSLEGCLEDG